LKPSVVPGVANSSARPLNSRAWVAVGADRPAMARTWLRAPHKASETPRVRLRARGLVQATCDVIPKLGRKRLIASFRSGSGGGARSARRPAHIGSVRNPAPPGSQKALDRRRRFTLIRLRTLKSGTLNKCTLTACMRFQCGGTRSVSLAKHVNCTPREGRGTESVNHFSRLPAG
jgi:hypothetical protein